MTADTGRGEEVQSVTMAETPRRQEGLQRVQIGLTGLAGVVLLVGLANIVITAAAGRANAQRQRQRHLAARSAGGTGRSARAGTGADRA